MSKKIKENEHDDKFIKRFSLCLNQYVAAPSFQNMLHYLAHKGAPELLKLYLHYTPFKFFIVSYGVL